MHVMVQLSELRGVFWGFLVGWYAEVVEVWVLVSRVTLCIALGWSPCDEGIGVHCARASLWLWTDCVKPPVVWEEDESVAANQRLALCENNS